MRHNIAAAALLALSGCAQSACNDSDVLAFVQTARLSRDLYAIGLSPSPVRQTPLAAVLPTSAGRRADAREAVCSAWLLFRNPAYTPGGGQPRVVRQRQDFWVAKLASGYEVGLMQAP